MSPRLTSLTVHRETVQLVVLTLLTAAAFVGTAALAAERRAADRQDAERWFRRAEEASHAADPERATAALRRAVSLRPQENAYVLALAAALSESGQFDAATRALMRIRAEAPDDPVINRAIARVAAKRHDLTAALRYYHNALYGPWPSAEGPRRIRLELIRFLLDSGDTERAVSELIAATTDLPETAAAHRELALLFAEAGEQSRALELFNDALRLAPTDAASTEGAVAAAFALGDYARAAAYPLPSTASAATRDRAQLAAAVVAGDPLESRLGRRARNQRLAALVARVTQRADECGAAATPPALARESVTAQRDTDAVADRFEQVVRATAALNPTCPAGVLDRAILLMARRHGISES